MSISIVTHKPLNKTAGILTDNAKTNDVNDPELNIFRSLPILSSVFMITTFSNEAKMPERSAMTPSEKKPIIEKITWLSNSTFVTDTEN